MHDDPVLGSDLRHRRAQPFQQRVAEITDAANLQANNYRSQFIASETLIAKLQNEQQQLAAALGFTVSPSSGK